MSESEIVKVWGTADSFSLTYTKDEGDGTWKVSIPADLEDGTYAIEIFAQNSIRLIAHWTGFLYMHNGKACIHLVQKKYVFWFNPMTDFTFSGKTVTNIIYDGSCIHGCRI